MEDPQIQQEILPVLIYFVVISHFYASRSISKKMFMEDILYKLSDDVRRAAN